ncbi:hypothetical protein apy_13430 [Aeropyrum pernix]|uniref:Prepilin type IV endopeptidase peptidase domain-containing protein n=1 Tax=Aeropyrum pernix TaxID=56636 RepID=A0A401HB78_AERPX|nr:hypothetical protein [Aeropyrum pernix]GBF09618.1 hypothetical protein apy_13430 [Aeropyrum pernix]
MGSAPIIDTVVFTPHILPAAVATILLLVAGLMDALWREIEPAYWYLAVKTSLLVFAASLYLEGGLASAPSKALVHVSLTLILVAVSLALFKLCLLGGSDVAAFVLVAVSSPYSPGLPIPPLAVALIASAPLAAIYITVSHVRLRRRGGLLTPEDLAFDPRFKWWIPRVEGEVVERFFHGCRLDADPPALAALTGRRVRAEPGIPLVAFIALGYLAYVAAELLAIQPI